LTCHHFSHKFTAVSTARYAAVVAIVTNYEGRFPAAELHRSAITRIAENLDGKSQEAEGETTTAATQSASVRVR
jgi:hypothetical protein